MLRGTGLPALQAALKQKEDWDDRPESLILVPNQASDQRFFDASGLVLLSDLRC